MAKPMTPMQAYKNSNPGAPMPRSMASHPMDESKKHEMAKGDKKEDVKETAMTHSNKLGAGAKKRAHLAPKTKVGVVMAEFKRGTLHSGSGDIVKKPDQAVAIALSEAGLSKKKKS